MAKDSGIGDNLYIDGYDLSGDIGSIQELSSQCGLQDITGLDKGAMERRNLLLDGKLSFNNFFNPTAGQAHPILKVLPATFRVVTYFHGPQVLGNPAFGMLAKQGTFNYNRGSDGSMLGSVECLLQNGEIPDWCKSLTLGKRTDVAATNGAGVDFGAASNLGAAAFLHVFAFTGTDITVKVQESSDDGSGDAYADVAGLSFTQVTVAPTAERKMTSAALAVERWLRAVSVTSGGFASAVFAVAANKR